MSTKNTRRYFLDVDEDGRIALFAPKRSELDEREKFEIGQSSVAPKLQTPIEAAENRDARWPATLKAAILLADQPDVAASAHP